MWGVGEVRGVKLPTEVPVDCRGSAGRLPRRCWRSSLYIEDHRAAHSPLHTSSRAADRRKHTGKSSLLGLQGLSSSLY